MNTKTKTIGIISLAAAALLLLSTSAFAADTAAWTTLSVSGTVANNLTLSVEEELRFDDVSDPSLARQHTDLSVGYDAGLLSAHLGYRNTSAGEHRPWVGLSMNLLSGDFDLDIANRMELRDWDTLRGRSKLSATTNVVGLAPWISDEVFVDESGLSGNRASVGVAKSVTDAVGVSAYYLLDSAFGDTTTHSHVMGLGISVSL